MARTFATLALSGILSLSFCFPAWGQAPSPQPITVDDAVRLAVSRNPRLEAAVRDVRASASGVRSARALTNPTVLFAPGITSVSGTGEEFIAQQPLEINGTRQARTAAANADLRGAQAQSLITLRDTVFQTKTAYYNLARAERRSQISRELLAVAQEADRIARKQVEEGARAGIDLAQTGIEVARAEREVTLSDGALGEARAALNTLLSYPPSQPLSVAPLSEISGPSDIPVPGAAGESVPAPGNVQSPADALPAATPIQRVPPSLPPGTPPVVPDAGDSLVSQALSARGETQAAVALRDRFRAEAALARAEGRPDLAPQVRVGYFTRGLQSASEGNGAGIGIGVTLPLFDYGNRRNRIRQAEEGARAQEARIAAAQNDIRQEVSQAQARLAASQAVLRSYQGGTLDRAKRLLEASQLGFREGRVSVVALLEAQRSYIAVQTEYAEALAGVATARAAIERATGSVPSSVLPTGNTK